VPLIVRMRPRGRDASSQDHDRGHANGRPSRELQRLGEGLVEVHARRRSMILWRGSGYLVGTLRVPDSRRGLAPN
jgi:hypothetical protein